MCAAALLLYPPIRQRGVLPDDDVGGGHRYIASGFFSLPSLT